MEKKRQRRKLYTPFTEGSLRDSDEESLTEAEPPLRRSRRIANRNRRSENFSSILNLIGPDSSDEDNAGNSGAQASRNAGESSSSNNNNNSIVANVEAAPTPPPPQPFAAEDMDDSSDSGDFRGFETNEQGRPTVINLEISGRPPILRFQRYNPLRNRRRNSNSNNSQQNNNSRS